MKLKGFLETNVDDPLHLKQLCAHMKWGENENWADTCFESKSNEIQAAMNICVQKSISTVRGFLIPDVINMVRRGEGELLFKINAGQAGSEDPTSDIDLNQNGENTEDMTMVPFLPPHLPRERVV